MYTKLSVAAAMLFAGNAAVADDHNVTVAIHVSAKGLDLSQPADARTFYKRIEDAAWVACTRADRVGLLPVDDVKGCCEKALGSAIRSTQAATLTQIYLATHTPREAAAHGIQMPMQMVAGRADGLNPR